MIEKLTNRIEYIKDIAYETSPNIEMIVKKINELVDEANMVEKAMLKNNKEYRRGLEHGEVYSRI